MSHLYVIYNDEGVKPTRAHPDDTGLDLKSDIDTWIEAGSWCKVPVGVTLFLERTDPGVPEIWDIQCRGRSGLATKGVFCHVGTIDAGYRGPMGAVLFSLRKEDFKVSRGDKIAQLIIPRELPHTVMALDTWLAYREYHGLYDADHNARGESGYGSTGR